MRLDASLGTAATRRHEACRGQTCDYDWFVARDIVSEEAERSQTFGTDPGYLLTNIQFCGCHADSLKSLTMQ